MLAEQFEKDLGYLLPFLDRVAAAAVEIEDSPAREELLSLISGEKERWSRISQLLAGDAGCSQGSPSSVSKQADSILDVDKAASGFTVGSLRNQQQR